jgi:hypothetical protein
MSWYECEMSSTRVGAFISRWGMKFEVFGIFSNFFDLKQSKTASFLI